MTTRQTPDAVREALRAQHDWHYEKAKALSKQPQTADVQWRRNEHREQIDAIAFALSALDSRAGDAGEEIQNGYSADDAVDFVFNRLAEKLGLADWQVVEGSEEWEGDVRERLRGGRDGER